MTNYTDVETLGTEDLCVNTYVAEEGHHRDEPSVPNWCVYGKMPISECTYMSSLAIIDVLIPFLIVFYFLFVKLAVKMDIKHAIKVKVEIKRKF